MKPEIAIVQQAEATEQQLIERAQSALTQCNWVVGECAAEWTQKHAKGRTDENFGFLIGMSKEQVHQRRRVWESFADVKDEYEFISFSHFNSALNWDDAAECLAWANDIQATVAEMKAWRRSQHGENLTEEPKPEQSLNDQWGSDDEQSPNDDQVIEEKPKPTTKRQPEQKPQQVKTPTPRRDEPSPISQVIDHLEHSIQVLQDFQQLQKHKLEAENLLEVINEQIAKVSRREE